MSGLRENDIYYSTNYLGDYIKLNITIKSTFISLLVLTIASFFVLVILFNIFLKQRIEMRKRDYMILKCLGNGSTIKKIIFIEITFYLLIAFIISIALFFMIVPSVNRVLSSMFIDHTNLGILIPILTTSFLIVIVIILIEITFIRKLSLTRELDVIK